MPVSIGELRGLLTLDDRLSGPLTKIGSTLGMTGKAFGLAALGVGVLTAAVTAVGSAVVALGRRGAVVSDVSDAFNALTRSADGSEKTLAALRRGVVGTVSDFELMKLANKTMGAGLVKTADDFEVLSAGSRMLAKRVGGDTSQAFETLTLAMASGRTAALKKMGIFVDSKVAVDKYKRSIGDLNAELNDEQRAAALASEALSVLRKELKENAPPAADFGEVLDRVSTHFQNLWDRLSVGIAQSPVVTAALNAIGSAFDSAFGDENSSLIQTIIGWVEKFVIGVVRAGEIGVEVARFFMNAWHLLKISTLGVLTGITFGLEMLTKGVGTVIEALSKIPVVGEVFKGWSNSLNETSVELEEMRKSLQTQTGEAVDSAAVQNAALDKVKGALTNVRHEMESVQGQQRATTQTTGKFTKELKDNSAALKVAEEHAKKMKAALESLGVVTMSMLNEKFRELRQVQDYAVAAGVPLRQVASALVDRYYALYQAALKSGAGIKEATAQLRKAREAALELNVPILDVTNFIGSLGTQIDFAKGNVDNLTEAELKNMRQSYATAQAYKTLGMATREELVKTAIEARKAFEQIKDRLSPAERAEALKKVVEAERAAAGQTQTIWTSALDSVKSVWGTLTKAVEGSFAQMILGAKSFKEGFLDIWKSIKSAFTNIIQQMLGTFVNGFLKAAQGALSGQKGAFGSFFSSLIPSFGKGGAATSLSALGPGAQGPVASGAGGGSLMATFAGPVAGALAGGFVGYLSKSKKWGALTGAGTGAAVGGMFGGPIGAGIGAAVGGVAGFLGGLFGQNKQYKELKANVLDFEKQLHATLNTQQKLEAGGVGWKMTTIAVRDAYAAVGKSSTEADRAIKNLWESSKKGPEAVKKAQDEILSAMNKQTEAQEALNAAIGRYKFTTEELGPALQRQALEAQMGQIYNDWKLLTSAGINVAAVGREMQASINEFLKSAIATGTEVPMAMKPMLEEMARMGLLTDASGNKVENLEDLGLSFSMTMTEGFRAVVESVNDLANVLRRSLGLAIEETTAQIRNMPDVNVRVRYDDPGFTPRSRDFDAEDIGRSGGSPGTRFENWGRGTPVTLHDDEAVITRSQGSSLAGMVGDAIRQAQGSGGGPSVINLNLDVTGVLDDGALVQTVQKKVVPIIQQAIEDNVGGTRTRMQESLGVTGG